MKKKRYTVLWIILITIILFIGVLVIIICTKKAKPVSDVIPVITPTADTSIIGDTEDIESYAKVLETFHIKLNNVGNVYDGTTNLAVDISNPEDNTYDFYVQLINANGDVIAETGKLRPGASIVNMALKEVLPVGLYDMSLRINIIINDAITIPYKIDYTVCSYGA